jgi:hypothetical protein
MGGDGGDGGGDLKSYFKQKFIPHLLTTLLPIHFPQQKKIKISPPRQRKNMINSYS